MAQALEQPINKVIPSPTAACRNMSSMVFSEVAVQWGSDGRTWRIHTLESTSRCHMHPSVCRTTASAMDINPSVVCFISSVLLSTFAPSTRGRDTSCTTLTLGALCHCTGVCLQVAAEQSGSLVYKIDPLAPAHDVLKENDVFMEIDRVPIADDGTVEFRNEERVEFSHIVRAKHIGVDPPSSTHVHMLFSKQGISHRGCPA